MSYDALLYEQSEASYTGELLGAVENTRTLGSTSLGATTNTTDYISTTDIGDEAQTTTWIGS